MAHEENRHCARDKNARGSDHDLAGNLLTNRSRSCECLHRVPQDLPALVELKDPLHLLVTLRGGLRKVSTEGYRAFQKLFGF